MRQDVTSARLSSGGKGRDKPSLAKKMSGSRGHGNKAPAAHVEDRCWAGHGPEKKSRKRDEDDSDSDGNKADRRTKKKGRKGDKKQGGGGRKPK